MEIRDEPMGTITWIEDTVEQFEGTDFSTLVDRDEAVCIAQSQDLRIDNPPQRVDAFIAALPSLFAWFGTSYRDFPWRRTRNPWAIIVAEILLRRTRAEIAEKTYHEFFERFPDPAAVHEASSDAVLKTVRPTGLGNRKTKTLKAIAKTITEEHGGNVPARLDILLSLPGVGRYIARACLCFAYGKQLAIVDTNVVTVANHLFRYDGPQAPHKDDVLYAFLDALIPRDSDAARVFNLALLDLPALVCTNEPIRQQCPVADACLYTALSD